MRTVAGRYLLEARIGAGGMGEVYRARHLDLGKAFALKVIAPAFADDAAARQAFHDEVRLASELAHPNIVSIVDYGEDDELGAFMVMELVEGQALLDQVSGMTQRRALDVLGQVADALDYIHKRGIIHGDVKADNIMITDEPAASSAVRRRREVRLLDFGLARRAGRGGARARRQPALPRTGACRGWCGDGRDRHLRARRARLPAVHEHAAVRR